MDRERALRLCVAGVLAYLPLGGLMRARAYGVLPGYRIGAGARVGFGSALACRRLKLGPVGRVGRWNVVDGPISVDLGDRVRMGHRNRIEGGWWALASQTSYELRFQAGVDVVITDGHLFDATGGLSLGDGVWVAGRGSEFWTHGLGVGERDITVGAGTYCGSRVLVAPGAHVGNNSVVALGAVVPRGETKSGVLLAGNPAQVVREDYPPRDGQTPTPSKTRAP